MKNIHTQDDLHSVRIHIRNLREQRDLTLKEVEKISHGAITAIALGSYERGDRQMSLAKAFQLAEIYTIPVAALLAPAEKPGLRQRITIDLRKISQSRELSAERIHAIARSIAKERGDWNGEIISLRESDLENLRIFANISVDEIENLCSQFAFSRSK